MKYTGIELLQAIKDKKIKGKIKVLYMGLPTKHILKVTEDNLTWEPGEFYVGELWDENYSFEVIEEKPKKIEKLDIEENAMNRSERYIRKGDNKIVSLSIGDYEIANKVNEIIDYLLEKESDK